MTKQEILNWLEAEFRGYPPRATGNEQGRFVIGLAGRLVQSNRPELAEAMRAWISQRGDWTLLAVAIAEEYGLSELEADIRELLADVRAGRAMRPYQERYLVRALKSFDPSAPRGG